MSIITASRWANNYYNNSQFFDPKERDACGLHCEEPCDLDTNRCTCVCPSDEPDQKEVEECGKKGGCGNEEN